ncbi:hypothetical protein EHH54_34680 [Rhizobium leguminosarum]|uniref:hypothetical protein n=1 Tax=Rhizobium leguminosarum TaxID=384 RepID=UPI000FEC5168|nr:hypothetical protein [Rhizobium leguminosarum]RWX26613.1 hypothetical protein EHH54_34680 [Rhizobium leguminosarum]
MTVFSRKLVLPSGIEPPTSPLPRELFEVYFAIVRRAENIVEIVRVQVLYKSVNLVKRNPPKRVRTLADYNDGWRWRNLDCFEVNEIVPWSAATIEPRSSLGAPHGIFELCPGGFFKALGPSHIIAPLPPASAFG